METANILLTFKYFREETLIMKLKRCFILRKILHAVGVISVLDAGNKSEYL